MTCEHWRDCGVIGGGCCNIDYYLRPSLGVCRICDKNTDPPKDVPRIKKSQGLGDTIKKMIDKATLGKVKPCGGCKKRQAALNKMMPYKGGKDAN